MVTGELVCPECGSQAVTVLASVWIKVDQGCDLDLGHGSGHEWDDESPAVCRECEFRSKVIAFDPEPVTS
jgi:hypothetical protein